MRKVVSWTSCEIRNLRRLTDAGMSAWSIHRAKLIPRHTEAAICAKMSELELGQAQYRERARKARRISDERRAEVEAFLQKEGLLTTSLVAAEVLGISQEMVLYYRRKLGLKLPDAIAFSSDLFRKTHVHVPAALSRGLANHRLRFWQTRRDELAKERRVDREKGIVTKTRRCLSCGEEWPATFRYFYRGRKDKVTGERKTLPHCRACGRNVWGRRLKKTA